MTKHKKLIISYGLLLLWMAVIFKLSSEGHDVSTGRSDAIVYAIQVIGVHGSAGTLQFLTRKAAHTIAYMILGGLALNVVRQYTFSAKNTVIISAIIPVFYAITDELHQRFVAGRSGEWRDVLIDSIAGLVGVGVCYVLLRRHRTKND